ncbi:MAG: MFS transporter [Dehalococcoidales bacterium]|nr:MFS transporter [Dehalococcoidales bacterium]
MGITSLLTDISSEMIFTLVPLFLTNVLGAAGAIVGLVGGLSEGADALLRIFSGWFSDKLGKRKGLAVLGYGISTIAKPFLYLASSWGLVLGVRFTDRLGKGVRTSSRDALIADSVSGGERGKAFGLHRAMDTTGAFLGLVIAALIVYFVEGSSQITISLGCFRWLTVGGVIPAVLGVIVLWIFVREKKNTATEKVSLEKNHRALRITEGFDRRFWIFLLIMGVFTLGNSSDFFVILKAQNMGSPLLQVVLMLILFNGTYAVTSYPMGILSDKLGRRKVIILGWFIYALSYLGFAVASAIWHVYLLFALYGIYYGIVEGAAKAYVADLAPVERRGTAFGLYQGVVGFTLVAASLIAGLLWDNVSVSSPFYLGAGLSFIAMLGIAALLRDHIPVYSA